MNEARDAAIVVAVANGGWGGMAAEAKRWGITLERVRQICKKQGLTGYWLRSLSPSRSELSQMRVRCRHDAITRRREAVAELRQQHLSSAEIREQLGLSRGIEHNDALLMGLTLHQGTKFPLLQDAEFMTAHQDLTNRQLADLVGCTEGNIWRMRHVLLEGQIYAKEIGQMKISYSDRPFEELVPSKKGRDWARELLRSTSQPLGEIALACGFASASHFTNRFRQALGGTPGEYRQAFLR